MAAVAPKSAQWRENKRDKWEAQRDARTSEPPAAKKLNTPSLGFFVSADSKGLSVSVSCLESTVVRGLASVDSKELRS